MAYDMSHYKYKRSKTAVGEDRKYSIARLNYLALPKERHPHHMPDRPSPLFLDYLLDQTPRGITDPQTLINYYHGVHAKIPRLNELSRPKTIVPKFVNEFNNDNRTSSVSRPLTSSMTNFGVSKSAHLFGTQSNTQISKPLRDFLRRSKSTGGQTNSRISFAKSSQDFTNESKGDYNKVGSRSRISNTDEKNRKLIQTQKSSTYLPTIVAYNNKLDNNMNIVQQRTSSIPLRNNKSSTVSLVDCRPRTCGISNIKTNNVSLRSTGTISSSSGQYHQLRPPKPTYPKPRTKTFRIE